MPLVYGDAVKRRSAIVGNVLLEALEIHGFSKCLALEQCVDNLPREQRIEALVKSLQKQFEDFGNAVTSEDKLEALADIRNVAGLLFVVQQGGDVGGR